MAALTREQKAEIRQAAVDAAQTAVSFTKQQGDAAAQAVEDWFEANRASLVAAIDTATAPAVLSAARKKRLVAAYLEQKAGRER